MNIRLDAISKSFITTGDVTSLFQDISVTFKRGNTYAIIGPSGSGKTTLLHIIAGLVNPTKGTILLNNHNLALMDNKEREIFLNRTIGLLFQMPYLIKELTVLENVMLKGLMTGKDESLCKVEAVELLEIMQLQDKIHQKPPVLSGGQQQRVALARALFGKPAFLLADEPTGDLDPHTAQNMIKLLLDCQKKWSMGIIVSTHDAHVASSMQTVYELQNEVLKQKESI
jgi:ABC-type lipoprotein export system ATPase subunit